MTGKRGKKPAKTSTGSDEIYIDFPFKTASCCLTENFCIRSSVCLRTERLFEIFAFLYQAHSMFNVWTKRF